MKKGHLSILSILFFFSLQTFAQEVRESNIVYFPVKKAVPGKGRKIVTIAPPVAWVFSDTAVISLVRNLNPATEPYYILTDRNSNSYQGTVIKTEIAPQVFQYTITENFPDGTVKRSDLLNERGRANGSHIEYWKPGVLKVLGAYMNGKQDGLWERFDSIGRIISTQRFQNGEAGPIKSFEKPHHTYYSAIVARTPAKPYVINPGENEVLKWKIEESDYAQIWSFQGGFGYAGTPGLTKLNYASMLGLPDGEHLTAHMSLTLWDPRKFFGEVEWKIWIFPSATGQYQNTNIKAGVTGRFLSFSAGYGILKRKRSSLSCLLGLTLANADLTSKDLDNSKGTSEAWFELSSLKQGPMLSPALCYALRFPFTGKYTPGISLKAGYHIPLGPAQWHLLDSPLLNREEVDLGGFFITAALRISRLRRL